MALLPLEGEAAKPSCFSSLRFLGLLPATESIAVCAASKLVNECERVLLAGPASRVASYCS